MTVYKEDNTQWLQSLQQPIYQETLPQAVIQTQEENHFCGNPAKALLPCWHKLAVLRTVTTPRSSPWSSDLSFFNFLGKSIIHCFQWALDHVEALHTDAGSKSIHCSGQLLKQYADDRSKKASGGHAGGSQAGLLLLCYNMNWYSLNCSLMQDGSWTQIYSWKHCLCLF